MTEPVAPDASSDEGDVGWGDDVDAGEREREEEERLREDRPPHHDRE